MSVCLEILNILRYTTPEGQKTGYLMMYSRSWLVMYGDTVPRETVSVCENNTNTKKIQI